jgi:ABC-type branched-subunit amino acid transport system substrate-binding protein/serine/threonine protein kinase
MIGELVGARYRVINVLASGGFGHTYIAEDTQRPGNPRCVLKHLTFNSQNTEVLQQVRRLFQAEAETLEQLGRHDQIPRLLAYFEENQQFYLVQEFVEGHPLSEELVKGNALSEAEVIPMLEDILSVLEYVHAQGVIHRDIKPANLIRRRQDSKLVLIDFGAVKLIGNTIAEATGETALSMPVYTTGYAASEQCMGRPRFASDIYALGMVGIQALTGLHPAQLPHDYASSEVIWRDQANVSDELANVLTTMTRYHFNDRYQSASDALYALRRVISVAPTLLTNKTVLHGAIHHGVTHLATATSTVTQAQSQINTRLRPTGGKTVTRVLLAIAGTLAVAILVRSFTDSGFRSPIDLPTVSNSLSDLKDNPRISAGEKSLITWQGDPQKQEGIDFLASGEAEKAIVALEAARQKLPGDPEVLIYLNNARIKKGQFHAIAVVAPISSGSVSSAMELLRGVAQAQDEINRAGGIDGVPLKVFIADDSNRPDIAEQLAKEVADEPAILGVVGHGTSDTSYTAGKIYQDRGLVMIAPVSSAVTLATVGDYIFRTMPNDKQTANALKNYLLSHLKKRKVAIFHNSTSKYSQSLKEEFKNALIYSGAPGVEAVAEFDLAQPDFDPQDSLNQALAKGAEVLMLAPDGDVVMDRAVRLVEANNRKLPILAGDSFFNNKLLRFGKEAATSVVLAVPVDILRSPFAQSAKTVWGDLDLVSWRSALAYDATKALITAIDTNPSRIGIHRSLANPSFGAQGATGNVNFQPKGDRNESPVYMTVAPAKSGKQQTYTFVAVPKTDQK